MTDHHYWSIHDFEQMLELGQMKLAVVAERRLVRLAETGEVGS
jgi:hypothetical protein